MKVISTSGKVQVEITSEEAVVLAMSINMMIDAINGVLEMHEDFHHLQSVAEKLHRVVSDEVKTQNKSHLN